MRFAIDIPTFGPYSDPRLLAALAHEAEDAGWDGFFLWDHVQVGWPDALSDPWIAMTAAACATTRIRLGAIVTPLYRRHPWQLARQAVTLDHLSGGRLVLGAGLGNDVFGEIGTFAGPADDRTRAAMLDEGLAVLAGLMSGEKFSFSGAHYTVRETQFLPAPLQKPRIPIWIAGTWPRKAPFRRAARYDGVAPMSADIEKPLSAGEIRAIAKFIRAHRTADALFDILQSGNTPGDDPSRARAIVAEHAEAGATWWLESVLPWKCPFDDFRRRIAQGPPRR
jgi:alkanesulfonate monooxygenase SsuD/methylene tetrahydromethanopterin reductase-like flavin-dependent oxidoreductase (luciferase family)